MNAYNENLHANVVTSLQNMEQELKTVSSASNAAMFTLYYAEGATITAMEKLSAAKDSQSFQENVKTQAVKNNNLSNNLLASATQAGAYLKQSVSNTSVAAANVQQAANAIVRLSSDIGSIYNIVQAANADTDIFNQAREANQLIKKTAYDAEIASQTAMEASIFTSKVSGNVVLDKAKSTNAAVGDLLKTTSTDFDNISQTVSDDNAALASASASEKLAEGVFEDSNTVTGSTASAYKLTNRELNNNLVAKPVPGQESTSFMVSFNTIRSPFFERSTKPLYPVQNYYLIVAKEKQKTTFTMSNAENIIQNLPTQCINLQMDKIPFFIPGSEYKAQFDFLAITGADGNTYALRDSDGDAITTGVDYVVFLLAVYHEDYKKKLNTFDDYLSAPSALFTFTNYLAIAKITSFPAANLLPPLEDINIFQSSTTVAASNGAPTIGIAVSENADFSGQVEYRCILLPANNNLGLSGMANMESLAELDDEIKKLEVIASELDPQIAATEDRLMETRAQVT
ncbi:MAG: hypothetical protein JNM68_03040, partial [Dinghuibacter sp.]|nr:hypothetical protein [Dinghuibacter sp.]